MILFLLGFIVGGALVLIAVTAFFYLSARQQRIANMAVIAEFQPVIDELNASAAAVAALKQDAAGAPSAQDLTDTLAAVQAAADGVKTAAGA